MAIPRSFVAALPAGMPVLGGLSSGDLQSANSFQIAGMQSGTGSLAAAFLRGNFKIGIGHGHGWHPVGSHFRVTRSRGFWLRTLDGHPASETYSQIFGQPARDWAFPPLNYLTRIYPLGFEQEHSDELLVRAPITGGSRWQFPHELRPARWQRRLFDGWQPG